MTVQVQGAKAHSLMDSFDCPSSTSLHSLLSPLVEASQGPVSQSPPTCWAQLTVQLCTGPLPGPKCPPRARVGRG